MTVSSRRIDNSQHDGDDAQRGGGSAGTMLRQEVVRRSDLLGLREQGEAVAPGAHQAAQHGGEVRRDPDPDRDRHETRDPAARSASPEDQLPRLHLRRDGDERAAGTSSRTRRRSPASSATRRRRRCQPPQIDELRSRIVEGAVKPKPARDRSSRAIEVRVIDGAFANFTGTVEEVKPDKQKLKVHRSSIFGGATPVELDFTPGARRPPDA